MTSQTAAVETLHDFRCWWCGHPAHGHYGLHGPCGDCWAEGRLGPDLRLTTRGRVVGGYNGQRFLCEAFVLAPEDVAAAEAAFAALAAAAR